jgi:hypothetical protein
MNIVYPWYKMVNLYLKKMSTIVRAKILYSEEQSIDIPIWEVTSKGNTNYYYRKHFTNLVPRTSWDGTMIGNIPILTAEVVSLHVRNPIVRHIPDETALSWYIKLSDLLASPIRNHVPRTMYHVEPSTQKARPVQIIDENFESALVPVEATSS